MSAARSIRFRRRRPRRWPWFLAALVVLAALGWTGWRVVSDQPISPFTDGEPQAETAGPPARADEPAAAAASEAPPPTAPGGEVAVRKVLENVMTLWVAALVGDDFSKFHGILAPSWRRQDDPARLLEAYGVLSPHKDSLRLFPSRGKLVLLESRPYQDAVVSAGDGAAPIRDNLGPETPWLVRGEWRYNKTTLGFTLTLSDEEGAWRPLSLKVEIFT